MDYVSTLTLKLSEALEIFGFGTTAIKRRKVAMASSTDTGEPDVSFTIYNNHQWVATDLIHSSSRVLAGRSILRRLRSMTRRSRKDTELKHREPRRG